VEKLTHEPIEGAVAGIPVQMGAAVDALPPVPVVEPPVPVPPVPDEVLDEVLELDEVAVVVPPVPDELFVCVVVVVDAPPPELDEQPTAARVPASEETARITTRLRMRMLSRCRGGDSVYVR
jgi:hypothetical protein